MPVDASGGPTVDPTENVKDLSLASNIRQDDLREANNRLFDCRIECLRDISALRDVHTKELNRAESRRVDEQAALREKFQNKLSSNESRHYEKLAEKESGRIDAIRAVDVLAVQTAAERAAAQAGVLASQVARTEETLRSLVATTAAAVANQLQQITASIDVRISALERTGYQTVGRQTFSDPAMIELQAAVKSLASVSNVGQGKDQGFSTAWAIFAGLLAMAVAVGIGVFSHTPSPAPVPVQSYYSAPPTVVSPAVVPAQPNGNGK